MVKNAEDIDYHELAVWIAEKDGMSPEETASVSTMELSEKISQTYLKTKFREIWDSLTPPQRIELPEKIESEANFEIKDKIGIATVTAAVAWGSFCTVLYAGGFTFYTTMNPVICASAGILGVTLPFGAYMSTRQAPRPYLGDLQAGAPRAP